MVLNSFKDQMAADDPPYSRLFVVYNRHDPLTEAELRSDYSQFGEVQDIFIVKDRATGEPKGVAYVKYSKMSDAALAMEKLNNTPIKNHTGTYKVYIAKSRAESKSPDNDDPDRYLRLFIIVPKTAAENDIRQHFSKFGDVQTIKLLRFKETNESKGIGYVTYNRIYEAAKAVEAGENEHGFKAVIARPKEKLHPPDTNIIAPTGTRASSHSSHSSHDLQSTSDFFQAAVSTKLTKDQIFRLFDVAPGLRDIKVISQNMYRSEVIATYNSSLAAEYALNKLHGIEYPLGEFISIESKRVNKPTSHSVIHTSTPAKGNYRGEHGRGDHVEYQNDAAPVANRDVHEKLNALTSALIDATALLKSAGMPTESLGMDNVADKWASSQYCNFQLPALQQVLPKTAFSEATGMRLFFVGHPSAPSLEALYDVYCRFGNFAGATIGQRKNYGYLYFASVDCALKAIEATDEKLISGMSMKVLKADPKGEPSAKRKRLNQ